MHASDFHIDIICNKNVISSLSDVSFFKVNIGVYLHVNNIS